MAATYNLPDLTKGDTFAGRNMATLTQSASPVAITRALMILRNANKTIVYTWDTDETNASITGGGSNVVSIDELEDTSWPTGNYTYTLKVWYSANGNGQTILKGSMKVIS